MAGWIFHGPPGSYKTSSAVWYEMLPALRNGRIIITNIEGMKPVDEIQKSLSETFPETADIWRVSTQKEHGRELMRNFYHWAPIGAMIIIDEVQDVYPVERTFKVENYDYRHIDNYKDEIPDKFFNTHKNRLNDIKPTDLTSADIDDINQQVFDDNGHIIYPTTLKEAFMRHRKYNWDILVCTPDITHINGIIRSACELAFHHSSKDSIGKIIPYYHRRPRIKQHPVKENGTVSRKADLITFRKVPIDVHKTYKSTATGKITASGVGRTPLSSGALIFAALVLVASISYGIYAVFFYESTLEKAVQVASGTASNGLEDVQANIDQDNSFLRASDLYQDDLANTVRLALPNHPDQVYMLGATERYEDGQFQSAHIHYELKYTDSSAYLTSDELSHFDIEVKYIAPCISEMTFGIITEVIFCKTKTKDSNTPVAFNKPEVKVF